MILVDDPAYKIEHSVKKVMDEAKKSFNIIYYESFIIL